jgi:hypothetical protein
MSDDVDQSIYKAIGGAPAAGAAVNLLHEQVRTDLSLVVCFGGARQAA